jgi:primosomal protein N'
MTVSSTDEKELSRVSNALLETLKTEFTRIGAPVVVYGPFEAPIYRSQGRYRKRLIVKCKLNSGVRGIFAAIYGNTSKYTQRTHISIDFNPTNL